MLKLIVRKFNFFGILTLNARSNYFSLTKLFRDLYIVFIENFRYLSNYFSRD